MKLRTTFAILILCILVSVSIFSLFYLNITCQTLSESIKKEEYDIFLEEFDRKKTILSFILDGKKVARAEELIEKIQRSEDAELFWLELLVEIEDWYISEVPSAENIF